MKKQFNNYVGKDMQKEKKCSQSTFLTSISIIFIMDATNNQKASQIVQSSFIQQTLIHHHHMTGVQIWRWTTQFVLSRNSRD